MEEFQSNVKWLNTVEAAAYLHMSRRNLLNIVARGKLRAYRNSDGGRSPLLYDRADLDAFVLQNKVEATA